MRNERGNLVQRKLDQQAASFLYTQIENIYIDELYLYIKIEITANKNAPPLRRVGSFIKKTKPIYKIIEDISMKKIGACIDRAIKELTCYLKVKKLSLIHE